MSWLTPELARRKGCCHMQASCAAFGPTPQGFPSQQSLAFGHMGCAPSGSQLQAPLVDQRQFSQQGTMPHAPFSPSVGAPFPLPPTLIPKPLSGVGTTIRLFRCPWALLNSQVLKFSVACPIPHMPPFPKLYTHPPICYTTTAAHTQTRCTLPTQPRKMLVHRFPFPGAARYVPQPQGMYRWAFTPYFLLCLQPSPLGTGLAPQAMHGWDWVTRCHRATAPKLAA